MIKVACLTSLYGDRGPAVQTSRLIKATRHQIDWILGSPSKLPPADVAYVMHSGLAMELQKAGTPTVLHLVTHVTKPEVESLSEAVSKVVVVSPSAKNLCSASNVVLIENAVPDQFCPGLRDPKLARDRPIVLYSGVACSSKGTDLLIRAVRDLPCELWLVGSVHPGIQTTAKNVVAWGYQTDLVPFYQSADLFILPSKAEGMSLSLLEAMASGLPCIASGIPSNRDTLRGAGLLCEVTVDSIRAAIVSLLDAPLKRQALAAEALRVAQTRKFSEWCARMVNVLEETACSSS